MFVCGVLKREIPESVRFAMAPSDVHIFYTDPSLIFIDFFNFIPFCAI